jgi:hypothetical protein
MKYISGCAQKSTQSSATPNATLVFLATYSKTEIVLIASKFQPTVTWCSKWRKFQGEVRFARFAAATC